MEQPDKYGNINELIAWLKSDLKTQRNKLIEKGIKREDIKDEELTLNVGNKIKLPIDGGKEIIIDFDFKFHSILKELGCKEKDGKFDIICPYRVSFKWVVFKDNATFIFSIFESNADFSYSAFEKEVNFFYSTFKKGANFSSSIFKGETKFFDSIFKRLVIFSYSVFENETIFLNTKIKDSIIFDNIKFKNNESNIIFKNINYEYDYKNKKFESYSENSKIEITNTVINGRIDFNNVKVSKINFKGSNVISGGVVNRINFEAYPENSDTARFLKHEEITRSDTIKALKYKAIEKNIYEKELKDVINHLKNNDKNKKKNYSILGLYEELFSITLSRVSNNHGQSWILAVFFTLISVFISFLFINIALYHSMLLLAVSPILFFGFLYIVEFFYVDKKYSKIKDLLAAIILFIILYSVGTDFTFKILTTNFEETNIFFKNFFSYLTPTNLDLMKCVSNSIGSNVPEICSSQFKELNPLRLISFYVFYILGKIFIGYGIFQTIQAFRKFNIKN